MRGISGSGKTTFSAELARRLGVPHVELDALHWGADWTEASADELRARVAPVIAGDAWVVDGSYSAKLGSLVADRAELVVWLDPPLAVTLRRLIRRTRARVRSGEVPRRVHGVVVDRGSGTRRALPLGAPLLGPQPPPRAPGRPA